MMSRIIRIIMDKIKLFFTNFKNNIARIKNYILNLDGTSKNRRTGN